MCIYIYTYTYTSPDDFNLILCVSFDERISCSIGGSVNAAACVTVVYRRSAEGLRSLQNKISFRKSGEKTFILP
jgi:hypothetical protein